MTNMGDVVAPQKGSGPPPMSVPFPATVSPLQSRVLLAFPWQKHVCPVTAFCVAQLRDSRRTATAIHYGDAFVAHTRNTCADVFLDSPCEWMLMIDDDMVVPFGNADWFRQQTGWNFPDPFMTFNVIDRLLSHKKTLVGALYFGRNKGAPAIYNEATVDANENKYAHGAPYNLIKPTRWVGTGCMMIHRSVFLDIEKRFPRLARQNKKNGQWFTSTEATLLTELEALYQSVNGVKLTGEVAYTLTAGLNAAIQRAGKENPLGAGEDVSFCMRAAAAGHIPFVDMGLVCGHVGYHIYGP
jgi:hypothetical protein